MKTIGLKRISRVRVRALIFRAMTMNQWEIEEACLRHFKHPVLGPAARFLAEFCYQVNSHSDGWAYWKRPSKAATKLMSLVQRGEATPSEFKAALTPIKSFYTRHGNAAGMKYPANLG